MSMQRTARDIVLGAFFLLVVAAPPAQAAGERIRSEVKFPVSPRAHPSGARPQGVKPIVLSWTLRISRPDGSRPANLKSAELLLPKNVSPNVRGFQTCPLERIQRHETSRCPRASIVGTGDGTVTLAPLTEQPHESAGPVYLTAKSRNTLRMAAYITDRDISTVHSVVPAVLTKSGGRHRLRLDVPRLPVLPGFPDATLLRMRAVFGGRDAYGPILSREGACSRREVLTVTVRFYDNSRTSDRVRPC